MLRVVYVKCILCIILLMLCVVYAEYCLFSVLFMLNVVDAECFNIVMLNIVMLLLC